MSLGTIDLFMIQVILPEILLLVLALIILFLDLILKGEQRQNIGWITAGGLAFIIGAALIFSRPAAEPVLVWGGMLRQDWFGFTLKIGRAHV